MRPEEAARRGFSEIDVVLITGDAYVDHPSFANALIGRLLEHAGYRVAILSQPDWRSADAFRSFGRPRLFFGVSAGNMDSMVNHYTANRKLRNDDAYSPGGRIGLRPDRATLAYCQRAREAFPGTPIIAGGIEASLRRIAHYDYWSDLVRRSIVLDAKPDLVVYGMGERTVLTIASRLARGENTAALRDLPGVAYRLGAREAPPADAVLLPSYEAVREDPVAFSTMTRLAHQEMNPYSARRLAQAHGSEHVVVNPPALPLTEAEMDVVYGLPFTREPHHAYGSEAIPAHTVVKTSVAIVRGCFGGCSFCSITAHEGRIVQNRSEASVLAELARLAATGRSGVISDLGGPTANMYRMGCTQPDAERVCRRSSCLLPRPCKLLATSHGPLRNLLRTAREMPGIRKVFVASGIRMDLALCDPDYIRELAAHHVGGLLKVAPEHCARPVLALMNKPDIETFLAFERAFEQASTQAGKRQHLVPYFIAGHPGSDLASMIELALFLERTGHRPDQVQDFLPSPFDVATSMYHTGLDPWTLRPVYVPKHARERRQQRALLQYFKPENHDEVRRALLAAGRGDLIGPGRGRLIPATPPRSAPSIPRARAGGEKPSTGYRAHRKSARRRSR
jgi:uncharacterized radical SAM protein YgiQ